MTRYDPAHRDTRGAYTAKTWTSWSDVGTAYDGERLTLAEYEAVESAYVDTATAFAREAGVDKLQAPSPQISLERED